MRDKRRRRTNTPTPTRHTKQYNLSLSALLLLCYVCLCTFSLFLCLFFNWWFYFPAARTRHIWSSGHSQSNGSCGDRWRDRAGRAPPPARWPFGVWFQQTDGGDPDVSQGETPCIHKVENRQRQTPLPSPGAPRSNGSVERKPKTSTSLEQIKTL